MLTAECRQDIIGAKPRIIAQLSRYANAPTMSCPSIPSIVKAYSRKYLATSNSGSSPPPRRSATSANAVVHPVRQGLKGCTSGLGLSSHISLYLLDPSGAEQSPIGKVLLGAWPNPRWAVSTIIGTARHARVQGPRH